MLQIQKHVIFLQPRNAVQVATNGYKVEYKSAATQNTLKLKPEKIVPSGTISY